MPTKRKVTGSRAAGAPHQQATLSFNGKQTKVTKLGAAQHAKTFKKDPLESDDVVELDSTAEDLAKPSGSSTPIASTVDQVNDEDAPAAAEIAQPIDDATKVEDVLGGRAVQSKVGAVGGKGSGWVADEEQQARKITEPQIARYWRAKEQERLAPRVHQEDLTLHEKLLREWDMTSQYGPCIGIARLKRWKRANMLGLNPPIEVLAVLLKDMDNGDARAQRAHVDELLSSRFVEA